MGDPITSEAMLTPLSPLAVDSNATAVGTLRSWYIFFGGTLAFYVVRYLVAVTGNDFLLLVLILVLNVGWHVLFREHAYKIMGNFGWSQALLSLVTLVGDTFRWALFQTTGQFLSLLLDSGVMNFAAGFLVCMVLLLIPALFVATAVISDSRQGENAYLFDLVSQLKQSQTTNSREQQFTLPFWWPNLHLQQKQNLAVFSQKV